MNAGPAGAARGFGDPSLAAFRGRLRAWLADVAPRHRPPLAGGEEELAARRAWEAEVHRGGYSCLAWPGYFPNRPAVVAVLLAAGADPNAPTTGPGGFAETPLHWAASTDDVEVARALIDGGADLEAQGGSIAGGGPLDNAVGYACWVEKLWHAAGLGMTARVEDLLAATPPRRLRT